MSDRPPAETDPTTLHDRINVRAEHDPTYIRRLIGWLIQRHPNQVAAVIDDIDRYEIAVAADPSTVTVDGLAGVGTARTTPAEPPNGGGSS